MPKKRVINYAKPTSLPHPSLASSTKQDASRNSNNDSSTPTVSVNELIRHLRQTQVSTTVSDRPREEPNTRSVHPSLKDILDIPDSPGPRPRPGMRAATGRRARGPAGPPPPKSWLEGRDRAQPSSTRTSGPDRRLTDKHVGSLPGLYVPNERSLEHLTLKCLAKNWLWHSHYDQYYLATLPPRSKETLLTYISTYNNRGIDSGGLRVLFLDYKELEGATGSESITYLDLGTSVGRAIKLRELKESLTRRARDDPITLELEDVPDSWDEETRLPTSISPSRFPSLTHLSLSNPTNVSWKGLLSLGPHLATLTHLSLAFWPTPSLTPNSKTAYRTSPAGNVDYGASNFYSESDGDFSEAAGNLKRLSKATYCLQWLDLTGCSDWVQALGRQDGPDWAGAWRGVETVKVGQGWIPACLESESSSKWRELYETLSDPWLMDQTHEERNAARKELIAWASIEHSITSAEVGVDTIVKLARSSSTSGASGAVRTGSVKFDRGWKGWWVDDALKHITPRRYLGGFSHN